MVLLSRKRSALEPLSTKAGEYVPFGAGYWVRKEPVSSSGITVAPAQTIVVARADAEDQGSSHTGCPIRRNRGQLDNRAVVVLAEERDGI